METVKQMSDMLQLVDVMQDGLAAVPLEPSHQDDKLKHIGHLLDAFLRARSFNET